MPAGTLTVLGEHFNPGHQVEVVVPGGFFGEQRLLDKMVTVASDSHCRSSRDCPSATGTFEVVLDFSAAFQRGLDCGDVLDISAIDLAPLQAGLPATAIDTQLTACPPTGQ